MTKAEALDSLARYADDLRTEDRRLEAEYLEVMLDVLRRDEQ
jgi:hypothetical protein